jgi:hypothetical protein
MSETYIIIKDQFPALHAWLDCPYEEVAFLRNPHRHIFFVQVKIEVFHDDRDVEFFMVKRVLSNLLLNLFSNRFLGSKSCEMLCTEIRDIFYLNYPNDIIIHSVSVFEDNENGAEVVF